MAKPRTIGSCADWFDYNKLHVEGLISDVEKENGEIEILNLNRQIRNLEIQIIKNPLDIVDIDNTIAELNQTNRKELSEKINALKESASHVRGSVAEWETKYLLRSPIDEVVAISDYWAVNQYVSIGEIIFSIVPVENKGSVICRSFLPMSGSGKVKKGQKVNIRLNGYPYMEYGVIVGKVGGMSLAAQESEYFMEIELPNPLITTYNTEFKLLHYVQSIRHKLIQLEKIKSK